MTKFTITVLLVLCIYACRKEPSFRFALFSDTHIGGTPAAAVDLRHAVADINDRDDIDFVIVSGDITDMNTGRHLVLAKRILDSLRVPYYIIPGNHDTKWSGSAGGNFISLWGDDKFVFDHAGYRFIGFHQGPVLRMGDGHISREVLAWLDDRLRKSGSAQPIFLVMHYPLNAAVDNWYECVDMIKDYNIKALLHGHGHRSQMNYNQGIPAFMGRSTLRAGEPKGGYTIFTVRNDSLLAAEQITGGPAGIPWAGIDLNEVYRVQPAGDSLLPAYSVNLDFPEVRPEWIFKSGYTMTASPVYDEQFAYVGDISGTVYALSLHDGKAVWESRVSGSVYGTAAVDKDHVVFTSADSSVYCLYKEDGTLKWKVKTGDALVSVPTIEDDIVFVGGTDGIFRALDLRHGEVIWQFEDVGGYVETRPLLYQTEVVFGAWDGKLYALDQTTGRPVWIWQGEQTNPLYSPAACWPVGADGKIFIAAPDRYLTAIDARNGTTIWRDNQWKFRETVGLSEDGKLVFGRSMTDSVIAFESRHSFPSVYWAADFRYGYDIAPSMPVEKDGTLFWGTKNGMIFAADASTGELLWQHKYQNYLILTVAPLDGRRVLFSNIDGDVVLLSTGSDMPGE